MLPDSHAGPTTTATPGWPPETTEAAPTNEAVTLRTFLLCVQEAIKGIPAAWVRCELHKVSAKAKLTELELVETDAAGAITVKIRAVVWQGRWQRIADAFAAAGLSLEAGSRVLGPWCTWCTDPPGGAQSRPGVGGRPRPDPGCPPCHSSWTSTAATTSPSRNTRSRTGASTTPAYAGAAA